MPELGRFARELRARLWKPSVDEEVRDEITSHLEQIEADLRAEGMSVEEARETARARFGDVERLSTTLHDLGEKRDVTLARREWFFELRSDFRQALRQLRSSPRFTLVAVLTLAVGLGASTVIFGIANAVLLRPLPLPSPDRLSMVLERSPAGDEYSISEPNYLDWAARTRAFAVLGAFSTRLPSLTGDGEPEQLVGAAVTHSFFGALGVAPLLGRTISVEEDRGGSDARVAVISHAIWQRRYGADPAVIGRLVDVDGKATQVIGVMPQGFDFPGRADIWTPLAPEARSSRGDRRLIAVGRLAAGVTMAQADGEMQGIAGDLAATYPESNTSWGAQARPLTEWFVSPRLRDRVVALLATVGLLLLMACVNVANLLLARASVREREMAVRAALGAGRWRLVRQLLTESLVLASLGAAAGTALAWVAIPLIRSTGGTTIPRLSELSLDGRVLAFSVLACLVTGAIFGLAPALRFSRGASGSGDRLHHAVRSGTRVADSGRLRNTLIVTSVALATVLLVSAGLVGSSFLRLMRTDLGFEPSKVLTGSIALPRERYDAERTARFISQAMRQLSALPGVTAAGATNIAPLSGANTSMGFEAAERMGERVEDRRNAAWRSVSPGYFETLKIPLRRGRLFDDSDVYPAPQTVIISEALAGQAWPGENPIGHELAISNGQKLRVVGVVGDARHLVLDSLPGPTMYFSHRQFPWPQMWLIVRTDGDLAALGEALRRELRAIDPLVPVANLRPLTAFVADTAAEPRMTMLVFAIFATAAIVLAAVGLYGVVSYSVAQRTREIGVSIALGARPGRIVRTVMGQGTRLAIVGVVAGSVLALSVTGVLRTLLYETAANDPVIFLAVATLLVGVAALASAGPARRAARLDPVEALRNE